MGPVVVIRYNAGNILSVTHALRRLGVEPVVSDNPEQIRSAERVIFPGVGEASTAMAYLRARGLDEVIRSLSQPVLGICLGLQLMCRTSEENQARCLGIFPGAVRAFPPRDKVPHMGWNSLSALKGPLFAGLDSGAFVYFVHGYYAEITDATTAVSDYILPFSAAMSSGNFHAVQFHPEKSGDSGAVILRNFLDLS